MQQWGRDTVVKFFGGELHFRLSGDKSKDDYIKDLQGVIARSENLTPALGAVGAYLMRATLRNFEAEGRPSRWQALQPETIVDRLRKGYAAGPILVRSGALKRSLTEANAPGALLRAGPKSLKYGSRLIYFRTHQHGDPSRNIPQRAMIVLQKQDHSQISRIINTYIRENKLIAGARL